MPAKLQPSGDVPGDQQRASGSDEGVRTQIRKRTRSNDFCFRVGRMTGLLSLLICCAVAFRGSSLQHVESDRDSTNVITLQSTCEDIRHWIPSRHEPAIILQVVSEDYIDVEKNFILFMEMHAASSFSSSRSFTRQNLYLMCLDEKSIDVFTGLGIQCIPVGGVRKRRAIWKLRVKALTCLVDGGNNVLLSDSDALWLGNPVDYMEGEEFENSDVLAQRAIFPFNLGREWGSTICMGFAMFRARGRAGMAYYLQAMLRLVATTRDDQKAANIVASKLGVIWGENRSVDAVRYSERTNIRRGVIPTTHGNVTISLLPHDKFTRDCEKTPISNKTIIAHCLTANDVGYKLEWIHEAGLWLVDDNVIKPLATAGNSSVPSTPNGN